MFERGFSLAAVVTELAAAPGIESPADVIEFRMDAATDPLAQLAAYDGPLPVLATNRASWEGGAASDDGRLDDLAAAARTEPVAAIDIELRSVEADTASSIRRVAANEGVDVVVSWHDFKTTPDPDVLESRLRAAAGAGTVGKAAVTATEPADVLDVLRVTDDLTQANIPVATMCMGEVGRHSRIVAPLYGSRIGYAPPDPSQATAPGQFDLETMASLISSLT